MREVCVNRCPALPRDLREQRPRPRRHPVPELSARMADGKGRSPARHHTLARRGVICPQRGGRASADSRRRGGQSVCSRQRSAGNLSRNPVGDAIELTKQNRARNASGSEDQALPIDRPRVITARRGTGIVRRIVNGRAYFDIHTTNFPDGEIRGFLQLNIPEPGTMLLVGSGVAGLVRMRRLKSR